MAQSEPLNGEGKPCRQKTSFTAYKVRFGITDDLCAEQRMEKLCNLFDLLAKSAQAISDNFQPEIFSERHNESRYDDMCCLLEENEHAVSLLQQCVDDMRAPAALLNGYASTQFAECSGILLEQSSRLKTGRLHYACVFMNDPQPVAAA